MSPNRRLELCRKGNVIYPAVFSQRGVRPTGSAEEIVGNGSADRRVTLAALFLESMRMVGG